MGATFFSDCRNVLNLQKLGENEGDI